MTSGSPTKDEAVCETVPSQPEEREEDAAPNEDKREVGEEEKQTGEEQQESKETEEEPSAPNPEKQEEGNGSMNRQEEQNMKQHATTGEHVKFFVGGLHPHIAEESLADHFKKYGNIVSVQVMRDFATKRSRGFGFVTLIGQGNTDNVYSDYHVIDGRKVDVRHMQADPNLTIKRKIFVGGISRALNESMLEEYFSNFGAVDKVTIMRQPDGSSRGFGFIQFIADGSAEKVLESPSHFVHGSKVDVRAAESRGKQAALRHESHYSGNYPAHANRHDRGTEFSRMQQYPQPMVHNIPSSHQAAAAAVAAGYDPQLLQQHLLYQQYALQGQYAYYAQQQAQDGQQHPLKDQSRYVSYRQNIFGSPPYSQNNIARSYRHDPY